jgi:hypothetical protein
MKFFKLTYFILFLIIPVMSFSQEEIPKKPDSALPVGYEWYLQQKDDGAFVWVPKQKDIESSHVPPARPKDELPDDWDWFPVYSGDVLITWKAQQIPTWFERNRALIEFISGFILSILNIFSFILGKKFGSSKESN